MINNHSEENPSSYQSAARRVSGKLWLGLGMLHMIEANARVEAGPNLQECQERSHAVAYFQLRCKERSQLQYVCSWFVAGFRVVANAMAWTDRAADRCCNSSLNGFLMLISTEFIHPHQTKTPENRALRPSKGQKSTPSEIHDICHPQQNPCSPCL